MARKSDLFDPWAVAIGGGFIAGMFLLFETAVMFYWTAPAPARIVVAGLVAVPLYLGLRYYVVLGRAAKRHGSEKRESYDKLRARIEAGGTPALVYNRALAYALDCVDRFFGDPERADESWFTRLTGWDATGARWTARAYDRCLLLALVYPVASVFVVWTISGQVGVAEATLALPPHAPDWRRALSAAVMIGAGYAAWRGVRASGWRTIAWNAVAVAGADAVAVALALAGAVVVAVFVAAAVAGAVAGAVDFAFAFAVAFAVAIDFALAVALALAFAVAVAVLFA